MLAMARCPKILLCSLIHREDVVWHFHKIYFWYGGCLDVLVCHTIHIKRKRWEIHLVGVAAVLRGV